jgi:hypothetical protein
LSRLDILDLFGDRWQLTVGSFLACPCTQIASFRCRRFGKKSRMSRQERNPHIFPAFPCWTYVPQRSRAGPASPEGGRDQTHESGFRAGEAGPSLGGRARGPSRGNDLVISGIQSPAPPAGMKQAPPAQNLPTYRVPRPGGIGCHPSTSAPRLDLRRDGRHRKGGLPPLYTRRPGPRGRLSGRRLKPRPAGCSPSTADNGSDSSNDRGLKRNPRRAQPPNVEGQDAAGRLLPGSALAPGGAAPQMTTREQWREWQVDATPPVQLIFFQSASNRDFRPCATGCNSPTLSVPGCGTASGRRIHDDAPPSCRRGRALTQAG